MLSGEGVVGADCVWLVELVRPFVDTVLAILAGLLQRVAGILQRVAAV